MDLDDRIRTLLTDVGHMLDLLVIDEYVEEHFWHVALDRDTLIFVEVDQLREVVVLSADVGAVTEEARGAIYGLLLHYSHDPDGRMGTHLSLGSAHGPVWLKSSCAVSALTRDTFGTMLVAFRQRVGAWREVIAQAGRSVPATYPDMFELQREGIVRA